MPESRQRLSRREMASHRTRAERMIAAGVNIQIRDEWREPARAQDHNLDIAVAGGCATFVFDWTAARAGYIISVRLVGQALGAVLDCRLTTAWDDHIVLASSRTMEIRCAGSVTCNIPGVKCLIRALPIPCDSSQAR